MNCRLGRLLIYCSASCSYLCLRYEGEIIRAGCWCINTRPVLIQPAMQPFELCLLKQERKITFTNGVEFCTFIARFSSDPSKPLLYLLIKTILKEIGSRNPNEQIRIQVLTPEEHLVVPFRKCHKMTAEYYTHTVCRCLTVNCFLKIKTTIISE